MKIRIRNALNLVLSDPKLFLVLSSAILRFILLSLYIRYIKHPVEKKINGVRFKFDFSLDPAVKTMYCGLYEPNTVEFMKQTLRPGDTFIDVGASIGYLSCIAVGLVGKKGQVHSFEPVPKYFRSLESMAAANPDYNIKVNNCALGDAHGTSTIYITNRPNIGWNTMVPGLMRKETIGESIEVPVCRLDQYIDDLRLERVSLIKIDVEGFEFLVLKGLQNYLERAAQPPVLICEIVPKAYPLLVYGLDQLSDYLSKYTYQAFNIVRRTRTIDIRILKETTIVVFIPMLRL